MSEAKRFSAPWGVLLWVLTGVGLAVLIGVGLTVVFATADKHPLLRWGLGIGLPLVGILCWLLSIRFYTLEGKTLYVHRPLGRFAISLDGLREVRASRDLLDGSIRLGGNGGLFAFTGYWRSKSLGRYRIFATDRRRGVLLRTAEGSWVVTPGDPDALVDAVRPFVVPQEGPAATPAPDEAAG